MDAIPADLSDTRPPPLQVVLEVARLAAVRSYGVLDVDLPELDGVAEAAARILDRMLAAVAFIDSNRLWFAGTFGLSEREAARAGSFCEQLLVQPGPLVVGDAMTDPRFRYGPEAAAGIRFMAGVGILDEDEYLVGALLVFDTEPGQVEPDAVGELLRLAALVRGFLIARRAPPPMPAIEPGRIQGWLGVRTRASRLHRSDRRPGLIVLGVAADSPADQAGLRPTDILLAIDGQSLWHPPDVVSALARRPSDGLTRLQILRAGQILECVAPIMPDPGRHSVIREVEPVRFG